MSTSNEKKDYTLDIAFDPPYAAVGSEYRPVVCTLNTAAIDVASHDPVDCDVFGIHVQPPPRDFLSEHPALGRLNFLDDGGQVMSSVTSQASISDSITTALQRCGQWAKENTDKAAHFILFVHAQPMEHGDRLSQVIEALDKTRIRCDVVCTQEELDLRLLNQVSILCGGVFLAPLNNTLNNNALEERLKTLSDQRVRGLSLSLHWSPNVLPMHIFSLGEYPRLLRDLGCEPSPYVHRFHLDPLGPNNTQQTILFEALVRRERDGEYKLGSATLEGTNASGPWAKSLVMTRQATSDPARIALRQSEVGLSYYRTRPSLDWELVCQAFAREDGNQIVHSIENLIGLAYETNREEDVAALRAMRMDFIRGGFFGLASLSRLWALAHGYRSTV